MKKLLLAMGLVGTLLWGGIYTQKLTNCLIDNTTSKDLKVLKKWIFFAFAQDEELKPYVRVTQSDIERVNRQVGDFFNRLLLEDCRRELKMAVHVEGPGAVRTAFQYLGRMAGMAVFNSPGVKRFLKGYTKYIDEKRLEEVIGE